MTTIKKTSLTLVFFCLFLAVSVAGQQCKSVNVAKMKSIFRIAPSPVGFDVLFYGSAELDEGELVTGNLFRLSLDGTQCHAVQLKAPSTFNPALPIWQPEGRSAYFESDQGIYHLDFTRGAPERFLEGSLEGMAISHDGGLLAFWRIGKGTDTLVVYDLRRRAEVRAWSLPDRFEGDKSGWDMAFADDGHSLYARTYDENSNTPLKRFDMASGEIEPITPECHALAESKGGVYFLAISHSTKELRKIGFRTARSTLVVKHFDYSSLFKGGNPRWIVAQDYHTKEIAILDTETDTFKSIGKYDSAAVLSNGNLLLVSGSTITVSDCSCRSK